MNSLVITFVVSPTSFVLQAALSRGQYDKIRIDIKLIGQ